MESISIDVELISETLRAHSLVISNTKFSYGGFAAVVQVSSARYNSTFAAKISPLVRGIGLPTTEFTTLSHISHPNIVNIFDYFWDTKYSYIILDWCSNGSLSDKLKSGTITDPKNIISSLISAIAYCHSRGICHSDIKPANILFDKYDRVKIVDFGLAKHSSGSLLSHRFAGSKHFMAPEVTDMKNHNPFKADVYSLGATMYVTLKNKIPDLANLDFEGIEEPMADCIRQMLNRNPDERPTIEQVSNMELFRKEDMSQWSKSKFKIKAAALDVINNQQRLSHSGSRVIQPIRLSRKAARSCPDVQLKSTCTAIKSMQMHRP